MWAKFLLNRVPVSAAWALFVLFTGNSAIIAQSRVVINEIMYAPVSPEPEWIELFNPDSVSVDITKWKISTLSKTDSLPSAWVSANGYVVITKDSTALRAKRPGSYPVVQCNLPPLVNTGDVIALKDSLLNLIDSLYYLPSWGGSKGQSLERKSYFGSSTDPANWGTSKAASGATQGGINSLSAIVGVYDIALVNPVIIDDSVQFTLINVGNDIVRQTELSLTIGPLDTILYPISCNLLTHDSLQVSIAIPQDFYGLLPALANVVDSLDKEHDNDSVRFDIAIPIPPDSLVINEIMFYPKVGGSQWIEILNLTSRWISMDSVRLLTGESKPGIYSFILPQLLIPADSFGLITANDSIFSSWSALTGRHFIASLNKTTLDLGRDSSFVVLHNYDSTTIDSVHYLKSWQSSLFIKNFIGISLERKDAHGTSSDGNNWQSCLDTSGGTPLAPNSTSTLTTPPIQLSPTFQASFDPNPFSPDGDGFQDVSTLTVQTGDAATLWALRVRIFDARGNAVRTLTDASTVVGAITLTFDGKRDNRQTLTPGIYAALIELTSQSPLQSLKKTIGVAIAGKRR